MQLFLLIHQFINNDKHKNTKDRLLNAIASSLDLGNGFVVINLTKDNKDLNFSEYYSCPNHNDISLVELEPRNFSFNSPHDPYDPPKNIATLYQDAPIPEPIGSAEELAEKPPYQREISAFYKQNLLYLTDYSEMTVQQIRRMREYYLATVTLVDKQIEKILQALESKNLLDSTLIVFSSDHGDHLGDHGLPFKSTYYESALMVPLIIRGPGIPAGTRCSSFIDWIDLHATFLALAGIEIPDHVQGIAQTLTSTN